MAKRTVSIIVCDKCGTDQGDVTHWSIKHTEGTTSLDLCKTCAKPVVEVVRTKPARKRKPRTPTVFSSEDEIRRSEAGQPT